MLFKDLYNIIKTSFFQFFWIVFIVSFLLFFLNVLLWISYYISNISEEVKHKLWIYFYIKDYEWESIDKIYSEAIKLKEELELNWLDVEYFSKDEAFKRVEKFAPEVIRDFNKYWIENPLPPTLYVVFNDKESYERLNRVVSKYQSIITNFDDVSKWISFFDQQKRILQVINLSNFLKYFSYFLIIIITVIIISFIGFVLKNNFYAFIRQIEVQKLLWAYYTQIKLPFLLNVLIILTMAFLLMIFYFLLLIDYLEDYFNAVFYVNLNELVFNNYDMLVHGILTEYLVILFLSLLFSLFFVSRLIKKI